MDKLHRITQLKRILAGRRTPITLRQLMDRMQCSESTARRALYSYRDDFGAPLTFDRRSGGWSLTGPLPDAADEVPGLWFTTTELHALLAARELLRELQPGLLAAQTAPIAKRIEQLLAQRGIAPKDLARRVRLQAPGMRQCAPDTFALLAQGLFERLRLRIRYSPRSRPTTANEPSRDISPQRFTWLRGNWYLDAWCHRADEPRRFAVERVQTAELLDEPAIELAPEALAARCDDAYGTFTGTPTNTAVLRFTAHRAQWVAEEHWHDSQQGSWLPDGRYQLTLPYARHEELLMEVLKYGADCEVMAPAELRAAVLERLRAALNAYADPDSR
ncbi:MAG: WYL domain-containing protein [Thiohalocapsa sp.]|jgi:predicted DNA-binding transcriptional regulator YafY|uniref:helix-turn-helix transcriptional regulator n=1 Tax=Thiohalocapsa sp. TaxID=2497641 RepID=UPI0025E07C58|nr:WYL domain-containing protein [Thiohalocapsa sp.]MCG6939985.1 WYL domain-containing protein [Thiohalocapsa sp.]